MSFMIVLVSTGIIVFWTGLLFFLLKNLFKTATPRQELSRKEGLEEDPGAPEKETVENQRKLNKLTITERQKLMNQTLQIDESDIDQNRLGIVSERQKGYILRREIVVYSVCFLLDFWIGFILMTLVQEMIDPRPFIGAVFDHVLLITVLFIVFTTILGFAWLTLIRSPLRYKGGEVSHIQGEIRRYHETRLTRNGIPRIVYF